MISIDRCKAGDINLLDDLTAEMGKPKDEGYFEFCLQEQEQGRRDVYILRYNGLPAGYGVLNWTPRYSLYKRLGISEIQDINVLPAFRRKGIAAYFIAKCEQEAIVKGHEMIGVSVGVTADFGPAQRLYAKLGYLPDGNGVTYDRDPVNVGDTLSVSDLLCLMFIKDLA